MVKFVLFSDPLRQEEIELFYMACQMHRNYYRGYLNAKHPLTFFKEPEYVWQCPSEMSTVYLSFPNFHVKYKQPVSWPVTVERTSEMPALPGRTLAGRFKKGPCKEMDNIYFVDNARQDEIETFYEACQRHRDFYRGYPNANHPLIFFNEKNYMWQCPQEMTSVYLSFPMYHVKYKHPVMLPNNIGRTSVLPSLPSRTLAGRFNKAACKLFVR